ncbi:hypothetical protein K432DRAFT_410934 [Lepidopterella palustris CBS 459.81]|uniref:FAD/NAD(P)-binding domain-containing protein n=1 Tax=Lepidopterella palustris CBS 459.81 TaxID=1314670 RepID=A0A8E2DWR2_9PEZI|nr:hypothetical protein K432DRAFT_410934 [Lepidopterella palustris CBS 459.81]
MRTAQKNSEASLQPAELIIGAGQAGLASGARLTQLGISCLIIDQNRKATGVNGEPQIPRIEGINDVQGSRLCHSSQFSSAQSTAAGKRVVVVGSGVSGHDIAQDFYERGHNVAIVQRSPTCIDRSEYIRGQGLYLEDGLATDADFLTHSIPIPLLKRWEIEKTEQLMLETRNTSEV